MAFAPLFFVALLAAAAVAAASRATSTTTTPGTSTRERIPPDLTLCRQSAAEVSILDSSALVRWVSCDGRTSQDVAIVVQRLEEAAHTYPGAGYDETARSVRTTWNAQIDAAEARDAEARAMADQQSSAPPRGRQTGRAPADLCATPAAELSIVNESRVIAWVRCPGRTPGEIEAVVARGAAAGKPAAWIEAVRLGRPAPTGGSAPTRSATSSRVSEADRRLEEELARAERAYPPARTEYAEAMARATPSELRRAADTIEDTDPSFREIPARLRRRAAERERAST